MYLIEDGIFAAIAAIGFSSISHCPRKTWVICAIAAALGHSLRRLLMSGNIIEPLSIIPASAIAGFFVGLIAVLAAPLAKAPAECCLFPALLPMIPGMYAYRTIEALVMCLHTSAETAFDHYMYLLLYNAMMCAVIIIVMVISATLPTFLLKRVSFQATR